MHDIDSINHIGMVARDLADTTARYEAMGFQLTPYSPHSGAWKPGEPVKPLGSGNRCVMFAHNYLEILASGNPAEPSERLAGYLRHHQGAHIICFNSEDPDAVDTRLRAAGIETSGVIPLQREIDTPSGVQTAKFQRIQFAPKDSPEGYIQAARHLTPEHIYQPRYIRHPNGCTELSNAYLVVEDTAKYAARYASYIGAEPEVDSDVARFKFSLCGALTILTPRRALELLPETLHPPLPGIAAVTFACPDLAAQRQRLRAAGIHYAEANGALLVPAEYASGLAVLFEERR